MKNPFNENHGIDIVLSHFEGNSNAVYKIIHKIYKEIGKIESDSDFKVHSYQITHEGSSKPIFCYNFRECVEGFKSDWRNVQYQKMLEFLKNGDKIKAMNVYRFFIDPDATLEEARFYIDNVNLIHE